jgi:hypothetical protein
MDFSGSQAHLLTFKIKAQSLFLFCKRKFFSGTARVSQRSSGPIRIVGMYEDLLTDNGMAFANKIQAAADRGGFSY